MKEHKTILRVLIFLFFAQQSIAQSIKWSQPLSNDLKMGYLKILGSGGDGYFVLRSNFSFNTDRDHTLFKTRKYELQFYSSNLQLRWSQPLNASVEDGKIADVTISGSRVTVLMTSFNKDKKMLSLYAQQINSAGKETGKPTLLQELKAEKVSDDNKPDLTLSHDQHILACAYRMMPKDKEGQVYQTIVFDTNLTVIYRKEIPVPVSAKRFTPLNFILTDKGDFFLLGIEFTTDKKVKVPGESFYKLFSCNMKNDAVSANEIKLENKFLTDVGISADNLNHNIVVAGFYSDKTTYSTAGVFYYSLSEDSLKQTPVVTSSFTTEFLRKFASERKAGGKELTNYSIDRVIVRKDGGAAIVAESFYNTSRSYWDYFAQMWITHYYYHYGNIMALSVNRDGSLLWSNVISKDQNSTDDGGYASSFFSAIINGKISVVYNKYANDPTAVLITNVSGTGEQNTKTLFNDSENTSIIPRSAKQVDADVILVPALKENKAYLVKISFE